MESNMINLGKMYRNSSMHILFDVFIYRSVFYAFIMNLQQCILPCNVFLAYIFQLVLSIINTFSAWYLIYYTLASI